MSLAVVTVSPRSCSGLAYSGVSARAAPATVASPLPTTESSSSFAMPKSSTFTTPSGGDEHVRRLEIAMDDAVLMCVLDGAAQLSEQRQPRRQLETPRRTVAGQRLSVDVLHHQVGPSVGGLAHVEERDDVRVREPREDLPLRQESLADLVDAERCIEDA